MTHKSGFVNIVGKPNAGKSTLMNGLVGEKLSIITSKAQTTRHRIMGIVNGEDFQMVYSDTPGFIKKAMYGLHASMNSFVEGAFADADVLLYLIDVNEPTDEQLNTKFLNSDAKKLVLINKVDLLSEAQTLERIDALRLIFGDIQILPISALHKFNVSAVFDLVLENLPEFPPYFPKDEITDKPERFFVAEKVREKMLILYKKEIPYSSEVQITSFVETDDLIKIEGEIYVERKTQQAIVVGRNGEALKKVSTYARRDLEQFFDKKIYLRLNVKVKPDWRNDKRLLTGFGYEG